MKAFLFSFCYNILYTVGWLVTLPSYLLKQKRRGGFGTGLLERFGLYRVSYNREPKGVLYVHAVSVGEVVLALKFLRAWLRERGGSAVLQPPQGIRAASDSGGAAGFGKGNCAAGRR